MKGRLALIATLLALSVGSKAIDAADPPRQCPDLGKLRRVCFMITSHIPDRTPNSPFEYLYERAIYEASCATYSDTDAEVARKIAPTIEAGRSMLQCQGADFDVVEGNVLKYAINSKDYGFVNKWIDEWHANLNWIDRDQTTALDYVRTQISRFRKTKFEIELQNYYNKMRKNGAKHRDEIR